MNLDALYPLIVPHNYVTESTWDLPYYPLPHAGFILTWVVFGSADTMTYLTREQYQLLEDHYPRWQQHALENLRHSLVDSETVCTQFKLSADKRRILFLGCMHQDGIGSSIILLASELQAAFPTGYSLALPDRSCGLIVPRGVTAEELADIRTLVAAMYEGATTPMSDELHASSDFTLPTTWTEPVDPDFVTAFKEDVQALVTE